MLYNEYNNLYRQEATDPMKKRMTIQDHINASKKTWYMDIETNGLNPCSEISASPSFSGTIARETLDTDHKTSPLLADMVNA